MLSEYLVDNVIQISE